MGADVSGRVESRGGAAGSSAGSAASAFCGDTGFETRPQALNTAVVEEEVVAGRSLKFQRSALFNSLSQVSRGIREIDNASGARH